MKIAFLCNSLEPGRDGVGDYTRLLAQECVRQGQECLAVALTDRWASEALLTATEGVPLLRIPAALSWPERIARAGESLDEFAPDWVSLQFVPYAFHPKGLVYGVGRLLRPLAAGRNVHLMFHELWIGEAAGAPFRHRLTGVVQRPLVLGLVRQLDPSVIHTSNLTYVDLLKRYDLRAHRLPLFGNLPVTSRSADEWLLPELCAAGVEITPENRDDFWLAGLFGTLHPTWPPEPLFELLHDAAERAGRRIVLLSVGRLGSGDGLWTSLIANYSPQIRFCRLGERSAEEASQCLNSLDFGIATSTASLIGKSGSVAAMLDHGLPIVANWDDTGRPLEAPFPSDAALLHRIGDLSRPGCLQRAPARSRLTDVAAAMLDDLACSAEQRGKRRG